jgi:hypothetical protein
MWMFSGLIPSRTPFARRFQLFALTQIGGEGDDLAAVFGLQPFQDDRGIKTARIGKDDFLRPGHRPLLQNRSLRA